MSNQQVLNVIEKCSSPEHASRRNTCRASVSFSNAASYRFRIFRKRSGVIRFSRLLTSHHIPLCLVAAHNVGRALTWYSENDGKSGSIVGTSHGLGDAGKYSQDHESVECLASGQC